MEKEILGTKRLCQSCSVRFYDMKKDPITCPQCGSVFDMNVFLKNKRRQASSQKEIDPTTFPVADIAPDVVLPDDYEDLDDDNVKDLLSSEKDIT